MTCDVSTGHLVGYVLYSITGAVSARVRNVFVDASMRSAGIGSAMVEDAVVRLLERESGVDEVCIMADKKNPAAIKAYVNAGFTAHHDDEVLMAKRT